MRRAIATMAAGLALMMFALGAAATDYPTKPIRLIIPFAAGGSTDVVGRIIANELGKHLGVSVIAENRSGAGGTIGTAAVKQAKSDGYTLLLGPNGPMVISPNLYPDINYHPVKDFAAVGVVATAPSVLLVNKDVPANSIQELLSLAKKEELTFASAGVGSTQFLNGEMFRTMAGIPLLHIPYKGGGPASIDLNAGRVTMMFDTLPSALTNLRLGKVRALGVTSEERVDVLKGVPSIRDTIPGFGVDAWYGLFAPAGTPKPVLDKLNDIIHQIAQDSDVVERLEGLGLFATPTSGDALNQRMEKELAEYKKLLEAAGPISE